MKTLTLNIYNKNKEVEKTLTAEGYDLMLGTCEDIMAIIDVDKMNDNAAITKMVVQCYGTLKPLLKDIFEGLTDEDFRGIKVKELIPLFVDICNVIVDDLGLLQSGN